MPNDTFATVLGMITIYWSGYAMAKAKGLGLFAAASLLMLAGSVLVLAALYR